MCGTTKDDWTALALHKPLDNGQAYEEVPDGPPGTLNMKKIWHPAWMERIDAHINQEVIKAVAQQAYDNEKVR